MSHRCDAKHARTDTSDIRKHWALPEIHPCCADSGRLYEGFAADYDSFFYMVPFSAFENAMLAGQPGSGARFEVDYANIPPNAPRNLFYLEG